MRNGEGIMVNGCNRKIFVCFLGFFLLVGTLMLSGCDELPSDGDTDNGNGISDCPSPEEVDALEQEFLFAQEELFAYGNTTEYEQSPYSTTLQQGNLTTEGGAMRITYEKLRDRYIETANNACEKTDGTSLEGGSGIWVKGLDLITKEIHPQYLFNLPIWSKKRYIYEEPEYWTGETTQYAEYEYQGEVNGYHVVAKIMATDVGTVEDQWAELAQEEGFQKVSYESGEPVGSTVYYTNYYENEYGSIYKGIYFQIFLFKVFAGYYSHTASIGTDNEYFNSIEFTEQDAKDLYEYLVYTPR